MMSPISSGPESLPHSNISNFSSAVGSVPFGSSRLVKMTTCILKMQPAAAQQQERLAFYFHIPHNTIVTIVLCNIYHWASDVAI